MIRCYRLNINLTTLPSIHLTCYLLPQHTLPFRLHHYAEVIIGKEFDLKKASLDVRRCGIKAMDRTMKEDATISMLTDLGAKVMLPYHQIIPLILSLKCKFKVINYIISYNIALSFTLPVITLF